MEEKESALGLTQKQCVRPSRHLRRHYTLKTESQGSQKNIDTGPVRKMCRMKTQPSSPPQASQNQLTINRKQKRFSLIQYHCQNSKKGFEQVAVNVGPGKLKSTKNKQHNRKSIQMYSSQEFFKTCLNKKTQQQQKAIKAQWRYLGKYGNQFQKMSLKTLANLTKNKVSRRISLVKRASHYINIEQEANVWITKSTENNNA